jgi:hypothetical protein
MSIALALVIAAAVLPHVGVVAATAYGRTLIGASQFFIIADSRAPGWGSNVDPIQLAVAINVIYLGLVEQQVGSLCARSGPSEYWRRKMSVVGCAESLWSPAGRWQSAHR